MSKLKLTSACGPYDRMEALQYKRIEVEGIDLNFLEIQAPREIFDRMVGDHAFDMSELSLAEHVGMTARGNSPFIALPVFPSKAFRHGFICINTHSGIKDPKDLAGKRIGVPLYTITAAIWIRGDLENVYGVDLSNVQWVQGAVEKAGSHGRPPAPPKLLKPVDIVQNTSPSSNWEYRRRSASSRRLPGGASARGWPRSNARNARAAATRAGWARPGRFPVPGFWARRLLGLPRTGLPAERFALPGTEEEGEERGIGSAGDSWKIFQRPARGPPNCGRWGAQDFQSVQAYSTSSPAFGPGDRDWPARAGARGWRLLRCSGPARVLEHRGAP